jgi:hypothetical protein
MYVPPLAMSLFFLWMQIHDHPRPSPYDHENWPWFIGYIWLPLVGLILSSVPGYISFLVLGVPTLYYSHKFNVTGYGIYTFFGTLYAFIAALVIARALAVLAVLVIFAPLGAFAGILTRMIVFGLNSNNTSISTATT